VRRALLVRASFCIVVGALSLGSVIVAAPVAGARPASSQTVPNTDLWGYVWANQPTTASYSPWASKQNNSSGASNTIQQTGVGTYSVTFPHLGVAQGTVDVSAYNGLRDKCKVVSWAPSGTSEVVNVACFDNSGNPVNYRFDAAFVRAVGTTSSRFGYVLANNPTSSSYTPNASYRYNSKAKKNTITRSGTGSYTVHFPGLETSGGTAMVTAYGPTSNACKVSSWSQNSSKSAELVNVNCFDFTGAPVDSQFTATFADQASILGVKRPVGYAWANKPTTSSYAAAKARAYDSAGGTVRISRTGTGYYNVKFPGLGAKNGDVQVTSYGGGSDACQVVEWFPNSSHQQVVTVSCFDTTGAPADTDFVLQYVR
jgi:hypothetical protein